MVILTLPFTYVCTRLLYGLPIHYSHALCDSYIRTFVLYVAKCVIHCIIMFTSLSQLWTRAHTHTHTLTQSQYSNNACAIHDYDGRHENGLSFTIGSLITNVRPKTKDWLVHTHTSPHPTPILTPPTSSSHPQSHPTHILISPPIPPHPHPYPTHILAPPTQTNAICVGLKIVVTLHIKQLSPA